MHHRTDGNPFYVVELLRLLGSGGRHGKAEARAAAALEIPAGVRDVLRRRLARLPEQTNAVLLVAAVVGREFDLDTIIGCDRVGRRAGAGGGRGSAVVEAGRRGRRDGGPLPVRARAGRRRDLRRPQPGPPRPAARPRGGGAGSASGSGSGRRGACAGASLVVGEARWSAPTSSCRTCSPAADQATSRLAHEDAERQLRRALVLLAAEPPSPERTRSELGVQLRLAALSAQLTGAASASTFATVTRAAELADELGDPSATITAYRSLYEAGVARAEHDAAHTLAGKMLSVAERSRDSGLLAVAHLAVGRTLRCQGHPAVVREHLERSLQLSGAGGDAPHGPLPMSITVRLQLAPVMDLLGSREEAAELLDAALDGTRTVAPLVRAAVLTSAALAAALGRDLGRARAHAAEALRLAVKLPVWSSYATAVLEWTKAVAGDPAGDIVLLAPQPG